MCFMMLEEDYDNQEITIGSGKIRLMLVVLALLTPLSAFAAQGPAEQAVSNEISEEAPSDEDAAIEAVPNEGDAADPDKSEDPNRGHFLTIPIFITEPAIGEGLGFALAYFHRQKQVSTDKKLTSVSSISRTNREQDPPPTITGVFGAYTSNETKAAGVGHVNTFKDDHIRFTGVFAQADVNSTFYAKDRPIEFNLEGSLIYQDTRFRFGDSKWFWGVGLSYLDARTTFKAELPVDRSNELFNNDITNSGLSAKFVLDSRDNTSMPDTGRLLELTFWRYDDFIGGDFNYWNGKLKLLSFHQLHEKFVLGFRLDYSTIDGRAPFFAIPYVNLRGIPALRFQGDNVTVAEIEGRFNITPKWALIGFAGTGAVSSDNPVIDTQQSINSYGLGGRYKIFDAQNIWVGLDVAKGPEEANWYIQVGHAW
jgi:hypothetical protein